MNTIFIELVLHSYIIQTEIPGCFGLFTNSEAEGAYSMKSDSLLFISL